MDVLVSLGTNAAYIYSLLAILQQRLQASASGNRPCRMACLPAGRLAWHRSSAEQPTTPSPRNLHCCAHASCLLAASITLPANGLSLTPAHMHPLTHPPHSLPCSPTLTPRAWAWALTFSRLLPC